MKVCCRLQKVQSVPGLLSGIVCIRAQVKNYEEKYISCHILTKPERFAVKLLKQIDDYINAGADKGGATVIWVLKSTSEKLTAK